jgi:hypothetical protein
LTTGNGARRCQPVYTGRASAFGHRQSLPERPACGALLPLATAMKMRKDTQCARRGQASVHLLCALMCIYCAYERLEICHDPRTARTFHGGIRFCR